MYLDIYIRDSDSNFEEDYDKYQVWKECTLTKLRRPQLYIVNTVHLG